jgi:hypothetical protein
LKVQLVAGWACRDGENKQARPVTRTSVEMRFFMGLFFSDREKTLALPGVVNAGGSRPAYL